MIRQETSMPWDWYEEEEMCKGGASELFKDLVSKQVESIDGLQSSFSQAHRAAKKRNNENYTTYNKQVPFTLLHYEGRCEWIASNKCGFVMEAVIATISVFQKAKKKKKKCIQNHTWILNCCLLGFNKAESS